MTTNHRTSCFYCKTSVLSRDYGRHLINKHDAVLFDKHTTDGQSNLKTLWREKSEREPLCLSINNDLLYFCLSDLSAIKRLNLAEPKVKKNKDSHRQGILKLRDKYPDPKGVQKDAEGGLTPSQIDAVQSLVWSLLDHIRDAEQREGDTRWKYEHYCSKALSLIPFSLTEKDLKAKFEEPEEEPEKEEEKEEQPEEEWEPILEPPKPKVSPVLLMVKEMMNDKDVPLADRQQYVRHAIAQHNLSDPELEMFLNKEPEQPKSTPQVLGSKRRPKVERTDPPALPPPPVEKKSEPKTFFNPQAFIHTPEPPKLPTILQSTKRSDK